MENKYFDNEIMIRWIAYAFIHAFWVYLTTIYALNNNLMLFSSSFDQDSLAFTNNERWNSATLGGFDEET